MKKYILIVTALVSVLNGWAQKRATKQTKSVPVKNKQVIFTYNNDTVYEDEFMRQFYKNRKEKEKPTASELKEYLDLYINFKLKVAEAKAMQLDTNPAFVSELSGYRKQLAAPYLTDKNVTDALMQEAYNRMKQEVNASHILINVAPNASAADTLAAYNKLVDIRKRVLKGENFDSLAIKFSDDPSAKDNYGKLGWFTVFQMVYPFENMAYNTAKGDVSMPFRTQFGYHIVKVNDKREARGEVKVQHIMIRTGYGSSPQQIKDAKVKIDSANVMLQSGASFEAVVEKYSQDDGSRSNKGVMNWVASLSGYPNEFKDICFGLNQGEISKPFNTDYGWHIVKLIEKRGVGDFKDVQDVIKNKINRDTRAQGSKSAVVERVKKENKYTEFGANLKSFVKTLDSSFVKGTWTYQDDKVGNLPVFNIGDKTYTQKDFAEYIKVSQQPRGKESIDMIARNMFNDWVAEKCLAYQEEHLEEKYDDFKNIMQEYHDGILLFDLTDKKVWSRAITDTVGVENFWAPNKNKYMWKERINYKVYTFKNQKDKEAAVKFISKGKSDDYIVKKLNKKDAAAVIIRDIKVQQNDVTGAELWNKTGLVEASNSDKFMFYVVVGKIAPEPKSLKDARGLVTSDYQDYLMKEWVKELNQKYTVNINQAAVDALAQ